MPPRRQVYLLDPQVLTPEVIAVTFAKTSRSPQSFREIAAGLTGEKSAEFHEKWVVGYGHASVAEHAVLHIAVENISRLAVEALESCRLASYTEKSTRYQQWGSQDFFPPLELKSGVLAEEFNGTCGLLFSTYLNIQPALTEAIKKDCPCEEGESEAAWDRRIHAMVVDISRFLLPAAAIANVGITINARALEHTLRKLLSHPLAEVREIGGEMKAAALKSCPTLIKYIGEVPYYASAAEKLQKCSGEAKMESSNRNWCNLVSFDPEGESRVLAAALYRFGECSFERNFERVTKMSVADKEALAQDLLGDLEEHDQPLRELEYASCTFDLVIDQGAFYELKRHRMMTLTPQNLTCDLGYAIPKYIVTSGVEKEYCHAMDTAASTYHKLAGRYPAIASYIVPNGFNRRVMFSSNLRSLFHLITLRSASNAHFSMRRLAGCMAEKVGEVYPILGGYMNLSGCEPWEQIESQYFHRTGISSK